MLIIKYLQKKRKSSEIIAKIAFFGNLMNLTHLFRYLSS